MDNRLYAGNLSFSTTQAALGSAFAAVDAIDAVNAVREVREVAMPVDRGLTRVVSGAAERLCWRFVVHGKAGPDYEPASSAVGPFDPDRARRLKRGETFQRLDRSGRPRRYEGLSWQPATVAPACSETPEPPSQRDEER